MQGDIRMDGEHEKKGSEEKKEIKDNSHEKEKHTEHEKKESEGHKEHHHKSHHEHKEHEHKHHTEHHKKPAYNIWKIVSAVLIVLLIITFYVGYYLKGGADSNVKELSEKEASEKVMSYIKNNLIREGMDAELVSISDVKGVYIIKIEIDGEEVESYMTKDAGLFFIQGMDMTKERERAPEREPTTPASPDIPKQDKPKVELFVMSFCPYGNRAEDTMYPVYELLKDKVDLKVHYIVNVQGNTISSLHGQPETDQNIREVCVKRDYGMDAFWKFMTYVNENCGRDGSCWEDAAKEAGADAAKVKECFDKDGFELMRAEAGATRQAGASGSPTMLINGVKSSSVYQYGNPELYKQTICSAFNEPPEECSETLGATTTNSPAGSCG